MTQVLDLSSLPLTPPPGLAKPTSRATPPHAETIFVSPDLAAAWLKTSGEINHRAIKPMQVLTLMSTLKRGEFIENGETIKFDALGRLNDGVHRLTAIVRSGVGTKLTIIWGLSVGAIHTVDIGTKRTLGDQLQIDGEKYAKDLAATIRIDLGFTDDGDWHQPWGPEVTYSLCRSWLDTYPELRDIITTMHAGTRRVKLPIGITCALYRRMAILDEAGADKFWGGVCDGYGFVDGDPRWALRERWLKMRDSHTSISNRTVIGLTAKAWNAWVDGKSFRDPRFLSFSMAAKVPDLKI